MKINKPTTGQLAAVGAVAGILGLALGGAALADGMARPDEPTGPRPYYDVVAEGTRQAVPPPPPAPRSPPPPPVVAADDGPRPPRVDHKPRGAEHAALDARHDDRRWDDDDRRGPPHRHDDRRARAQTWVLCDIERDGDVDCDEDDWRGAEHFRPDRDSRGTQWVRCEVERDGDIDCDEDDRRTWASTPPAPPRR